MSSEVTTEKVNKIENPSTVEEVLDTRSPLEIEQELMKQAEQSALDAANKLAPEDMATFYFKTMFPIFRDKVHGLSAKNAKQLLIALVQYPVMEANPNFTQVAAGQAFQIGNDLFNAKFILRTKAEMELMQREVDSNNSSEGNNSNSTTELSPEAKELVSSVETTFEQGQEIKENE